MKYAKMIFTVVGVIVGLIIVKGALFDIEEQLGWEIFWDALKHHQIGINDFSDISKSTTFIKSVLGIFVGGTIGYFIGKSLQQNNNKGA